MKNTIKTLAVSTLVASLGMGFTMPTYADATGVSDHVKSVNLELPGYAAIINIKNISGSQLADNVNLKAQESSMSFQYDGEAYCAKSIDIDQAGTPRIYFGPVSLQNELINKSATLHDEYAEFSVFEWQKVLLGKNEWVAEGTGEDTFFDVPLNKVKNGHPVLRVDPVAEIEKAAQIFVNNGGTLTEFYKEDREVVLQRPISVSVACKEKNGNKTEGFATKNHTIQIKYKGDKNLKDVPQLNAQLSGNLPNQIQQNEDLIPFKLNNVQFNANTPHYVGKCLPEKNPKIRMHFTVAGGKKGQIDLRVKAVGGYATPTDKYFETEGIIKDPKNGGGYLEFNFPLIEKLSSDKYTWMAIANNKTHEHGMLIEARYKNFDGSNTWSEWKSYDGEILKHRCVPQVNVPSPAGLGGYDNNSGGTSPVSPTLDKLAPLPTTPKIDKIQAPVVSEPKPVIPTPSDIQLKPMTPKPTVPTVITIKTPINDPKPKYQRSAQ